MLHVNAHSDEPEILETKNSYPNSKPILHTPRTSNLVCSLRLLRNQSYKKKIVVIIAASAIYTLFSTVSESSVLLSSTTLPLTWDLNLCPEQKNVKNTRKNL